MTSEITGQIAPLLEEIKAVRCQRAQIEEQLAVQLWVPSTCKESRRANLEAVRNQLLAREKYLLDQLSADKPPSPIGFVG